MKSLSPLVLLAFLSTMLVACCSAVPQGAPMAPAAADTRTRAERAESMSVAVLDKDGDPVCGGVWVGPTKIVTANHCIRTAGMPDIRALLEALGVPGEGVAPPWNPVGQSVQYMMLDGDKHPAVIQAVDEDNDLALLDVLLAAPPHDIAFVDARMVRDGEELDVVGSTIGDAFTYSRCYVAKQRIDFLQVSGPVYMGNSGGGAFDDAGHLVGIANHMTVVNDSLVPDVSFFTLASTVRRFLTAATRAG